VLLWHYHDDDVPGPAAHVELNLTGLALPDGEMQAKQFRIDADHSNCYEAWKRMGEPMEPSPEQYAKLEAAGKLAEADGPKSVTVQGGAAKISLDLPRQGVVLIVLEWFK
jgi:xylan 1,4-beta-xylosidase